MKINKVYSKSFRTANTIAALGQKYYYYEKIRILAVALSPNKCP